MVGEGETQWTFYHMIMGDSVDILSYDYVPEREQGHEFTVSPGACRMRVYCGVMLYCYCGPYRVWLSAVKGNHKKCSLI